LLERIVERGTHNCGIDKGGPALALLKQGKDERHGCGTEQDNDQLVLELLENQLPDGCRGLLWQRYTVALVQCMRLEQVAPRLTVLAMFAPQVLDLVL
jgi:hypothetical protein